MLSNHVLSSLKAYTALIGSILTALLAEFGPDTPTGHWLAIGLAVVTAVSVWAVPNADAQRPFGEGHTPKEN